MCAVDGGRALYSGSTNVRVWSAERGENTHVVSMRAFTSVTCMALAPGLDLPEATSSGPKTVWLGHSDGSVTSIETGLHQSTPHFHLQAHKTSVAAIAVVFDMGGDPLTAAVGHTCSAAILLRKLTIVALQELWTGSDSGTIRAWPQLGMRGRHSVEVELPGRAGERSDSSPAVRALLYIVECGLVLSGACLGNMSSIGAFQLPHILCRCTWRNSFVGLCNS